MSVATGSTRPNPTTDLDKAAADLETFGACIVDKALAPDHLAEVHTALYRAAEADRKYGWTQDYGYGGDDHVNQRVWNLPSRDPAFCSLAEHPAAMHFVKQLLGWPALLSSMSANITAGGGASMILHADQGYMPTPWSRPLGVNIAWCVDDFTLENGATCYVPGSHHWNGQGMGQDMRDKLVPLEAPAGSAIIMEGRLLHTNGVNTNGVRHLQLVHPADLPAAGELVPLAQPGDPPVRLGNAADPVRLPAAGHGPHQRARPDLVRGAFARPPTRPDRQ
jgi:ectoine hydroxylase-related dioxygenase (phytanoyl-CoA dioxygenase family)